MNVVTLIGNLATDVELKDVGEDKQVASFVLAVDRIGKDGDADFFRVSTWNKQAELVRALPDEGSAGRRWTAGSRAAHGRTPTATGGARSKSSRTGSSSCLRPRERRTPQRTSRSNRHAA